MIVSLLSIAAFIIALIVLLFTEQGREVSENIFYHLERFRIKLIRFIPFRSHKSKKTSHWAVARESRFVRDVTIMDGSKVKIGNKFQKIWEIENIGKVPWENRFLERVGPCQGPGRLKSRRRVRIPYTLPGQKSKIKVNLIAPDQPGSCYAEWKMVDEKGSVLLPDQKPLFVSVDITE